MNTKRVVIINSRSIGPGHPTYIIAEMSGNHNQHYERAVEIIHAMHNAGADAVKLQTYTPDTMTMNCNREEFVIGGGTIWDGKTLYELYEEASTPWEWHPKLKKVANDLGMDLFSTPFDPTATDFLEEMDVPAYKIASFELVDIPLIKHVASKGKPIIMSTGMATKEEIADAVQAVNDAGNDQLVLLKCTSAYPALPSDANLNTMNDMRESFGVPVGLSDHTLGHSVPIAATVLGGCIIEKHFCLTRDEPGVDSAFSLEPHEFKEMVDIVRATEANPEKVVVDEAVLGDVVYRSTSETSCIPFRRSLFVVEDMRQGESFTEQNIRSIRPGNGLPPKHLPNIIGKKAAKDISRGTPLAEELITTD
ncbi:MAG: pseudaminic acid synthase [Candidatus Peregrinibacteria bacterium]|nr:pseudaminic acid synthase [Candidatus Peregrinibacteria bacterium]MCB9807977.1 pseudaminic acid synthase [Candidatus Peribacteria bacterium]